VSKAVDEFWAAVESLANDRASVRREPDVYAEIFIPAPAGTLEISGRREFVSVACGYLFIEDRAVCSTADADFLLAVCDAVLAGRAQVASPEVHIELMTRGYSEVWTA
jgi:hypothetical protein